MNIFVWKKEVRENFSTRTEYSFEAKEGFEPMTYANFVVYTDVNSYEIVGKFGKQGLLVRRMKGEQVGKLVQHIGGFSAHTENSSQKWEMVSDEEMPIVKISLRKNGSFHRVGTPIYSRGLYFFLSDSPQESYDYNF